MARSCTTHRAGKADGVPRVPLVYLRVPLCMVYAGQRACTACTACFYNTRHAARLATRVHTTSSNSQCPMPGQCSRPWTPALPTVRTHVGRSFGARAPRPSHELSKWLSANPYARHYQRARTGYAARCPALHPAGELRAARPPGARCRLPAPCGPTPVGCTPSTSPPRASTGTCSRAGTSSQYPPCAVRVQRSTNGTSATITSVCANARSWK
jgi:hypothetical protein